MNAPELLATVAQRGAVARCETDADGAAVLIIAPRSAVVDLLPDLARFKPQLLELLEAERGERRELAALVLASLRRPGAGLHYSRGLALAWRRVCDLTGQTLDSPALVIWARETLNQWN